MDAALLVGVSKYGFVFCPEGDNPRSVAFAASEAAREHALSRIEEMEARGKELNLIPSRATVLSRGGWADMLADSCFQFVNMFNEEHDRLKQLRPGVTVTLVDVFLEMNLPGSGIIERRVRKLVSAILAVLSFASAEAAEAASATALVIDDDAGVSNEERGVARARFAQALQAQLAQRPNASQASTSQPPMGTQFSATSASAYVAPAQNPADQRGLALRVNSTGSDILRGRMGLDLSGAQAPGQVIDLSAEDPAATPQTASGTPATPGANSTAVVMESVLAALPRDPNNPREPRWPLQLSPDFLVTHLGQVSPLPSFSSPTHIFPSGYAALRHLPACCLEAYDRCRTYLPCSLLFFRCFFFFFFFADPLSGLLL
jgi:hypothetical protein